MANPNFREGSLSKVRHNLLRASRRRRGAIVAPREKVVREDGVSGRLHESPLVAGAPVPRPRGRCV